MTYDTCSWRISVIESVHACEFSIIFYMGDYPSARVTNGSGEKESCFSFDYSSYSNSIDSLDTLTVSTINSDFSPKKFFYRKLYRSYPSRRFANSIGSFLALYSESSILRHSTKAFSRELSHSALNDEYSAWYDFSVELRKRLPLEVIYAPKREDIQIAVCPNSET